MIPEFLYEPTHATNNSWLFIWKVNIESEVPEESFPLNNVLGTTIKWQYFKEVEEY